MALRALGGLALVVGHLAYGDQTICESSARCVNVGGGTAMRSIQQAMQSAIDAGNGDRFFAPGATIACHCGSEGSICANFQSAHKGGSLQSASESVLQLIDNGCTTCGQVTSSLDGKDASTSSDLSVSFVSDPVCCKNHDGDASGVYCLDQKAQPKSVPKEDSENQQSHEVKEQAKPKQPSNPEVSPIVTPLRGRQAPIGTSTRTKPSGTTSNPNKPTTSKPPSCSLVDAEDTDEYDEYFQKREVIPKATPPPMHERQAPIGTTTRRKPSGTTSNPNKPTTSKPPSCSLVDAEDTDEYDEYFQKREVLPKATPPPIHGRQAPVGTTTRRKPSGTTSNPNKPTTSKPPSCSLIDAEDTDEYDEYFQKREVIPKAPKATPPPVYGRQAPIGTTTRRKPSGTTSNPNRPTTSKPPSCSLVDAEDTDEYDEYFQKRDISFTTPTPQPIGGRQAPIGTSTRTKPSGTTSNPNKPTTSKPASCSLVDAEDTDEFDALFRKRGEPGYDITPTEDEVNLPRMVEATPTPEPTPEYIEEREPEPELEPVEEEEEEEIPEQVQEEAQPEESHDDNNNNNDNNNGESEGIWANYDENTFASSQRTVRAPKAVPWTDADHAERSAKVRRAQQLLNLLPDFSTFGRSKPVAQEPACDVGESILGPQGEDGAWEFELLNDGPEGTSILQKAGTDALHCFNLITARDWDTILLSKIGNMQFQIYEAPNCNPCSGCVVYNEDQANTTTTSIGTKSGDFFAGSIQVLPNGAAPGTCLVI